MKDCIHQQKAFQLTVKQSLQTFIKAFIAEVKTCNGRDYNGSIIDYVSNVNSTHISHYNNGKEVGFFIVQTKSPRRYRIDAFLDKDFLPGFDLKAAIAKSLRAKASGDAKPLKVVTFEGMDYVGKTTLAKLVQAKLIPNEAERTPIVSALGDDALKKSWVSKYLLRATGAPSDAQSFSTALYRVYTTYRKHILDRRNDSANNWLFIDRGILSSMVYQAKGKIALLTGMNAYTKELFNRITDHAPLEHYLVIVRSSDEVILQRAKERGKDDLDEMALANLNYLNNLYNSVGSNPLSNPSVMAVENMLYHSMGHSTGRTLLVDNNGKHSLESIATEIAQEITRLSEQSRLNPA